MGRSRLVVLVAAVVTAVASVAAIGTAVTSSDGDDGATTVTTSAGVTATGSLAIEISEFTFGPAEATVAPGTEVVWTNADPLAHTIRSGDGSFDSPELDEGDTFSFVFTAPGEYPYVCGIHDSMTGTITVEG